MKLPIFLFVGMFLSASMVSANDSVSSTQPRVCEVRTSKWEKDVSNCEKGDVLSIFLDRAYPFVLGNVVGRLCELDQQITPLGTSYVSCIYTGSALELVETK